VRETDPVAHLGGDGFTVILPDINHRRYAELITGKVVQKLVRPFKLANVTLSLSASVRVCISSGPPPTPETLLKNADLATYAARPPDRGAARSRHRRD